MKWNMGTSDRFDGFAVTLSLDDDEDWLAHFVELPNVSAFAESPELALNELASAWEGVKESYHKRSEAVPVPASSRECSGQFNVRIDKRLHRALAVEAEQSGVLLNTLVAQKLAKASHAY